MISPFGVDHGYIAKKATASSSEKDGVSYSSESFRPLLRSYEDDKGPHTRINVGHRYSNTYAHKGDDLLGVTNSQYHKKKKSGTVDNVYVDQKHRGKKLASGMLEQHQRHEPTVRYQPSAYRSDDGQRLASAKGVSGGRKTNQNTKQISSNMEQGFKFEREAFPYTKKSIERRMKKTVSKADKDRMASYKHGNNAGVQDMPLRAIPYLGSMGRARAVGEDFKAQQLAGNKARQTAKKDYNMIRDNKDIAANARGKKVADVDSRPVGSGNPRRITNERWS